MRVSSGLQHRRCLQTLQYLIGYSSMLSHLPFCNRRGTRSRHELLHSRPPRPPPDYNTKHSRRHGGRFDTKTSQSSIIFAYSLLLPCPPLFWRVNHIGMTVNSAFRPSWEIEYRGLWLELRRDVFTCVGWKITPCDPIRQVTPRSSRWSFIKSFTLLYLTYRI